ncbi:Putative type II secretion system protein E [Mariniblastus fucicola]|uniref:Type II secretion system protein E n=2 Tax=Mariniblastus fucicola TaxID=980251 RepID=A0A5B9PI20_9BACT|nr:Putative type II secretion system protein E [Mariniblastus fucicola]
MPKLFAFVLSFSAVLLTNSQARAGVELIGAARGQGGYLSLVKIGLIALVFFIWVRLADWINRDTTRIGDLSGQKPQVWNPINIVVHLAGFFAAISIPIFWVGYPIYVACAFLPWFIYRIVRRSGIKKDSSIKQRLNPDQGLELDELQQDLGAEFEFTPAGETDSDRQSNLIRARQSPGFVVLKDMLSEILLKRANIVLIDYSQTQATPRILVDGTWHPIPPMDRETGDNVLYSLKYIAGLNPADRRNKQAGRFAIKSPEFGKRKINVVSQGIPNGERVQLKLIGDASAQLPLKKLGMLPSMEKPFAEALNKPGICIVSAPKGEGLTTTWQGLLLSADRLTRDCVGLVSKENEEETTVENIVLKYYMPAGQGTPNQKEALAQSLLTRPDSMAVFEIESPEVTDVLSASVKGQDVAVWLQTSAKSSVEALLRCMQNSKNPNQFADSVRYVTNQRLGRRLCDHCKQEVQVQPKLIQQLGGDPRKQKTIFQAWRLPPPEQRVDETGKPIEFPTCQTCGGLGHVGRIAIFEMLTVNDEVRKVLKETPKPGPVDAIAKRSNAKTPLASSAYRLVLLGVISLQEAQASLKK